MNTSILTPCGGCGRAPSSKLHFGWIFLGAALCLTPVLRAQLVNDGATRTLSNVTNNIPGTVTVGTNGSFTLLTLADNALLTNSSHGIVGINAMARSNEVRLTSGSARWQMGGNLFVGSNGAMNRLVVSNGAFLENNNGVVGSRLDGSNNFALITGSGSLWSNRSDLTIGTFGRDNRMIVSNGGWVASQSGTVSSQAGASNNLVLVTGSGSVWSNAFGVTVGNAARGNLVVEAGGLVHGDSGTVGGFGSASNSEVLVTGPGSRWNNVSSLTIGNTVGRNHLVVSNGATVWSGTGFIGSSSNQVVVTGAGSVWSNQTSLFLGSTGNRVDVSDGGWLACNDGNFIGSSNTVVLTGGASGWNNLGGLIVGEIGSGNMLIASNGATVLSSNATIGVNGGTANNNLALLTGAGSLWSNRNDFVVGNSGVGNRLALSNSGTVLAGNLFVGFNSISANNRVTVDGGTLRVANGAGTGVLDVRRGTNVLNAGLIDVDRLVLTNAQGVFELNGGTLMTRGALISNGPFIVGSAGANPAIWDARAGVSNHFLSSGLFVGFNSSFNQFLLSDGAVVTGPSFGTIGAAVGANSNTALLSGAGSQWRLAGSLNVGVNGAGNRLVVGNGALAANLNGVIGLNASSSSNVANVTGAGAVWSNATSLIVGNAGPGNRLLVSGAGAAFAGNGVIGQNTTASANTVLVSDAGSQWRLGGNLDVGSGGSFNGLVVSGGAMVSDQAGFVGTGTAGSNNAAVVTGAGSVWSNAVNLCVGAFGASSQLIVSNGGMVIASSGGVGDSSDNNQAVVTGSGSVWNNASDLNVGSSGAANRLVVKSGGLLVNGAGAIGVSSPSNEVNITGAGSVWSNRLDLSVGVNGRKNQLLVSDGGTAFTGGNGGIGEFPAATSNTVIVSDSGSRWLVGTNLFVGKQGAFNRLVVSNGGFVSSFLSVVGSRPTASNNVAVVTGPGSVWSNSNFLAIGDGSPGNELVVSNGGSVISREGFVGEEFGSDKNLAIVTGAGSSWLNSGSLFVGFSGNANRLVVTNAGLVVNELSQVGIVGDSNEVIVTGPGSLWSNRLDVSVGYYGSANRLVVNNGGTVFGRNIVVGEKDTSTNNRVVVNGGTLRAANAAGTSVLDVRRGTNVLNAGLVDVDQLVLTNKGTVNILLEFGNGGSINIPSSGPATPFPSTIAVAGLVGTVTNVSVTLSNLSHIDPDNLDVLLVSPAGQKVMLMSDAGGLFAIANVRLTFDDTAAAPLPTTLIGSGTYRPTDYLPGDILPAPAPPGPYSINLSSFNGSNPNGVWSLYINDDSPSGAGSLVGWSIQLKTDEGPFLDPGAFELNGGTLVTRGASIDNSVPFVVGGPGGVPAVWDVRAGASDHFVARDLIVGSFPAGSSNNLLHVTGGTLHAATLDVRGGTNRLDAGLVDVDRLVVTNTRGQVELNGGTLRTPDTTVANGRVFTVGNGPSAATLQLLGGTHSFSNNLTVANNGSLIGNGVVDGTVTVSAGGRLVPGAPIGRIDVDGTIILQGAVNLQIDKSGGIRTNDQVTASGVIFYGGALNVTDIGADDLTAGDRFPLFSATPFVGVFTTLSLPPLDPGLAWANHLAVDGSIEVITATSPAFRSIFQSGTNVVITGSNGVPNTAFQVLASTNVALPLSNWVSIATNQFDGSGRFVFTTAIIPAIPQRFYRIQVP